jgi:acyl-CoA thioester hydrolase
MFERTFIAGWGDMDFNSHMRNTAYLDKSADIRMMYFSEHGFPMDEFMRLRIGPVIMKDEVEYFKEVQLLVTLKVTLSQAGQAQDGSRFLLRNDIYRSDGKLAARVTSSGGWLDLSTRKLTVPPDALLQAMQSMPKTDDFQVLASSIK